MKTGLLRQKKSRFIPAHAVIAVLALAGAIGLQWLWQSILPPGTESWRLYFAAVLLSATAWLVSTTWLHASLARGRSTTSRTLLQAVADIAASAIAMFILAQGHTSPLALSGLSPLIPLLLAIAAPSALLLLATALTSRDNRSNPPQYSQNSSGTFRFIILAALLVSLSLIAAQPLPKNPPARTTNPQIRETQKPPSENLKSEI